MCCYRRASLLNFHIHWNSFGKLRDFSNITNILDGNKSKHSIMRTSAEIIYKVALLFRCRCYCKKFYFITECPPAPDGMERFACPTPDRQGRYHCIDDHVLCDGFIDCPSGEDEDRQDCMFYKTVSILTLNIEHHNTILKHCLLICFELNGVTDLR